MMLYTISKLERLHRHIPHPHLVSFKSYCVLQIHRRLPDDILNILREATQSLQIIPFLSPRLTRF